MDNINICFTAIIFFLIGLITMIGYTRFQFFIDEQISDIDDDEEYEVNENEIWLKEYNLLTQDKIDMSHLIKKVHEMYKNNDWKISFENSQLLLKERRNILPILKQMEYSQLIREFDNDREELAKFLSFINRDYLIVANFTPDIESFYSLK